MSSATSKTGEVTIRPREDNDIEGCISLLTRVYEKDGYPVAASDYRAFLQFELLEQAWIAECNRQVVGHVAVATAQAGNIAVDLWRKLNPSESVLVLERLFLDPEYRGSGIAARLIECAVQWSYERGYQRLLLFVLEKDPRARRLYERIGWRYYGCELFRYGDGQAIKAHCFASPSPGEHAANES